MIRKLKSGEYRLYSRKLDPKTGRRRNLGTFAPGRRSMRSRCSSSSAVRAEAPRPSPRILELMVAPLGALILQPGLAEPEPIPRLAIP